MQKNKFSIFGIACGIMGIVICAIAMKFRIRNEVNILELNFSYTQIGWVLRISGFIFGTVAFILSILGIIKFHRTKITDISLCLSSIAILWEVAMVIFVICFIILVISNIG